MADQTSALRCLGCGLTFRHECALTRHMRQCEDCLPRERAQLVLRRQAQQAVYRKRPREAEHDNSQDEWDESDAGVLPVAEVAVLAPATRWAELDPVKAFGNERTYTYFQHTLHAGQFSHARATTAVAHELATTSQQPEPLLLEASNALRHGYSVVDQLADEVGLGFTAHKIPISFGSGASAVNFTATMHLRSLLGLCRLGFSRVSGQQHCIPRRVLHEGRRVYSHPYTARWAEQQFEAIRACDHEGLLWAVDAGWDKSSLSTVQSAYPLYLKFNAWPQDEQNRHRGRFTWGYFDNLPEEIQLQLSTTRATQVRRQMAVKMQELAFSEFKRAEMLTGQQWEDKDGVTCSVYIRTQMLILDYIDYALTSGTLQNQACPICKCQTGSFHKLDQSWPLRSGKSASAAVAAAWMQESSATAVRARLRTEGYQVEDAPLRTIAPGLEPHSGVAYARLHNDFEGFGKISYEACVQRMQLRAGPQWSSLIRRIDAWVTEAARFTRFTTFSRGLSYYFYTKSTGSGRGRGGAGRAAERGAGRGDGVSHSKVQFGKIASKQVYRDIFRFWRACSLSIRSLTTQICSRRWGAILSG